MAAQGPPADDRNAVVYPAIPVVTRPIEQQEQQERTPQPERTPSSLSAPVVETSTTITVTSAPAGARVTVDGIGWGETPVTIHHLRPGQKVVRVTKAGYESQQRIVGGPDRLSAAVRVTLRARN